TRRSSDLDINSVIYPSNPREGTLNARRTWPFALVTIFSISPFRAPRDSMTAPVYSSGTSICTRSTGSHLTPSISLIITFGLDSCSSNPSRRIFSIKMERCSSPLPDTVQASGESVSSTRKLTSLSKRLHDRSCIFLWYVNLHTFDRFTFDTVDFFNNYFWFG